MSEYFIQNPHHYRHQVLRAIAVIVGFFALSLSALNFYLGQYSLMAAELLLTYAGWFVYHKIQLNRLSYRHTLILPYFIVVVIVFGTFVTPLHNGLFIWTLILPTVFYLLLGSKHGFWASLVIALLQVVNILLKENSSLYSSDRIAINFVLAYVSIWIVSRTYEVGREQSQVALQELAMKDYLTGVYNRLALKKHFKERMSSNSLVLVLIDIDFFKNINDNYGHEAGDFVLFQFAKLLQESVGANNVFRLGGEEFCLLLEMTKEDALNVFESIKSKLRDTEFRYKNDLLSFTFSAGVADMSNASDLSELLADADRKLYKAKNNGRNQAIIN